MSANFSFNGADDKKSQMAVHVKSRELHVLLSKVYADDSLIPKYFKESIGKHLIDHSFFIYTDLAAANAIDLFDKEVSGKRRAFQDHAYLEAVKLLATLRVLYDALDFSSDKMHVLLSKALEIVRLTKKWIESDLHRQGAALHIVKKDPIETSLFDKGITAKDLFTSGPKIDFDDLYKVAASPVQEKHHQTKKEFVIPPAPKPDKPYRNEPQPQLTREERIAKILESRAAFDSPGVLVISGENAIPSPKEKNDAIVEARKIINESAEVGESGTTKCDITVGKTPADEVKTASPLDGTAPEEFDKVTPELT